MRCKIEAVMPSKIVFFPMTFNFFLPADHFFIEIKWKWLFTRISCSLSGMNGDTWFPKGSGSYL